MGYTLTAGDLDEINRLLIFRDDWIRFYQRRELDQARERQSLIRYVSSRSRGVLRCMWRVVWRLFNR